jgi:hypothetical protein
MSCRINHPLEDERVTGSYGTQLITRLQIARYR